MKSFIATLAVTAASAWEQGYAAAPYGGASYAAAPYAGAGYGYGAVGYGAKEIELAGDFETKGDFENRGDFEQAGDFENKGDFENRGDFEQAGDFETKGDFENRGDFEQNLDFENKGDFENRGDFEQKGDFENKGDFEIRGDFEQGNKGYGRVGYGRVGYGAGYGDVGYGAGYGAVGYGAGYGATAYDNGYKAQSYGVGYGAKDIKGIKGIKGISVGKQDLALDDISYGARDIKGISVGNKGLGDLSYGGYERGYGYDDDLSYGGYGRDYDGYGYDDDLSYGSYGGAYGYGDRARVGLGYGRRGLVGKDYSLDLGNRYDRIGSRFGGYDTVSYAGYDRGYGDSYGYATTREHTKYGPYDYNRPRVDYDVKGVRAHLGVHGPKARLGVMEPRFGYKSEGGQLTSYGPILGNKFQRPEIETYAPKFAFKKPEVSFMSGQARTQGPSTAYRSARIQQTFVAPEQHLRAPEASARLAGPVGKFGVKSPVEYNVVDGPQTSYSYSRNTAYVQPKKAPVVKQMPAW